MKELKPCPFCGFTELQFYNEVAQAADGYFCDDEPSQESGVIICDATLGGCGATSGFGNEEVAIINWNKRVV